MGWIGRTNLNFSKNYRRAPERFDKQQGGGRKGMKWKGKSKRQTKSLYVLTVEVINCSPKNRNWDECKNQVERHVLLFL